ncbi:hypothetical protein MKEN_01068700 [Mycena kentingensis (nom. inval.)]|nr:hypothetical protein MKEN_01068700 [Mycena kentingensis (nom. inval.)]
MYPDLKKQTMEDVFDDLRRSTGVLDMDIFDDEQGNKHAWARYRFTEQDDTGSDSESQSDVFPDADDDGLVAKEDADAANLSSLPAFDGNAGDACGWGHANSIDDNFAEPKPEKDRDEPVALWITDAAGMCYCSFPGCGAVAATETGICRHFIDFHLPTHGEMVCGGCPVMFGRLDNRNKHQRTYHPNLSAADIVAVYWFIRSPPIMDLRRRITERKESTAGEACRGLEDELRKRWKAYCKEL